MTHKGGLVKIMIYTFSSKRKGELSTISTGSEIPKEVQETSGVHPQSDTAEMKVILCDRQDWKPGREDETESDFSLCIFNASSLMCV